MKNYSITDGLFPSKHGDKEYAYSLDLPGRVVKSDQRGGMGSLLRFLSKEPDCNSLCYHTRSLNSRSLTKKQTKKHTSFMFLDLFLLNFLRICITVA